MKRDIGMMGFGIVLGLLATGVLWLVSSRPRGKPVELLPPPTAVPLLVHISGAVARPGVEALAPGDRVQDAIRAAGGLSPGANSQVLNLAAPLADGDMLIIPTLAPTLEPVPTLPPAANTLGQVLPAAPPSAVQPATNALININTANLEKLDRLPGIGPKFAQRIIDYRESHGQFMTIEAIIEVDGIGPTSFERIKDLITTGYYP